MELEATMDLFTNNENILSSDEYSEEEDLNYTAISVDDTNNNENRSFGNMLHTNLQFKLNEYKNKRERTRFALMAKKKAIKWLNSKHKREKRIEIVRNIFKDYNTSNPILPSSSLSLHNVLPSDVGSGKITEKTIPNYRTEDLEDLWMQNATNLVMGKEKEKESFFTNPREQNVSYEKNIDSSYIEQIRSESNSPTLLLKCNDNHTAAETSITNKSQRYNDVDKLFPKYNKHVQNFVRSSSNTVDPIEFKISETLMEIKVLTKMIKTKEFEWNKLLHLRKVKEEVIMHLAKKKHVMELKNRQLNKTNEMNNLSNRRQFSLHKFDCSAQPFVERLYLPSTALSLVESRANMGKEDLEKEIGTINRLQRILFSGNLSNSKQSSSNINIASCSNEASDVNINLESVFKDNSTLITDFQQKRMNINKKRKLSNELYNNSADLTNNKKFKRIHMDDEQIVNESRIQFMNPKHNFNDNEIPLCQACNSHESRFVCAGCGNQWYCSRRCQVSDWDNHSDVCQE